MFSTPSYDDYLARCAEEYNKECTPEVIRVHKEYEGRNEDGTIEYSTSGEYNCQECDNDECEHWKDYNEDKYQEMVDEIEEYIEDALEGDYKVPFKPMVEDLYRNIDTVYNIIENSLPDKYILLKRSPEGIYSKVRFGLDLYRNEVFVLRKGEDNE